MSNSGFPGQWAKHIDAVWGAQQRRTPPGPGGFGGRGGPGGHGGPPPWLSGLFGLGGPDTKGPKVRRGDVRSAILDVVRSAAVRGESVNGYQVIQQIAERSDQAWRPSPGSVYPTIAQLEDEGLLLTDESQGRKSLQLTDEGRTYVEEHAAELAAVWAPFAAASSDGPDAGASASGSGVLADLKPEIGPLMSAVWQLVTQGSESQRAAAVEVLADTRRRLYGILADDATVAERGTPDPSAPDQDVES